MIGFKIMKPTAKRFRSLVQRRKLIRDVFGLLLLGLICLQIYRWQSFAFEASTLGLRSIFSTLSVPEHLRWGFICNSVQNYECSEYHFSEVFKQRSDHLPALGNLAIARSKLDDQKLARETFERYFAAGGLAYDVMAFFAQVHAKSDDLQGAIDWMYRSLSVHTSNQRVANDLLDHLAIEGRLYEALSLTGALMEVDEGLRDFWQLKFDAFARELNAAPPAPSPAEIRVPSLNSRHYFVPVRFDANSSWVLFNVDQTESETLINEDILSRWSFQQFESLVTQRREKGGRVNAKISQLQVGPWILKNVDVMVCESCPPQLGRSLFSAIEVQKGQDRLMDYIVIKNIKSEKPQ